MSAQADVSAYARARAAAASGAVDAAAAGYAAVLASAPSDQTVAARAYRNGLASGDMAVVRKAAGVLRQSDAAPMDLAILDLADGLRGRNRALTESALDKLAAGPLDFAAPIIRAWLAHDRRQDPFAILDDARDNGLGRRYIAEHRALLLIARGRTAEGLAGLRTLLGVEDGNANLRRSAAALLVAKGQRKAAAELLGEASLAGLPRVKGDASFATSKLYTRLASDLAGQQADTLSIVLTRSALLLDPGNDRARLLLASALKSDSAYGSALAALDPIRSASPFYAEAQAERIAIMQARGDGAAALDAAEKLAALPTATRENRQLYADLLVEAGRDAEAVPIYAAVLEAAGDRATWADHLQLGGALERAGQWEQAKPHLRRAVELGPNQAIALNYLGYSLVDRGENIAEGKQLLERASALRPEDPSITDSLGWAYYRSGDHARALPLLERAAQGNPGSPTINEHLGDAYWVLGRRFEARYAWRAASIYAEGEQKTRITTKLVEGLRGDGPSATQRARAN